MYIVDVIYKFVALVFLCFIKRKFAVKEYRACKIPAHYQLTWHALNYSVRGFRRAIAKYNSDNPLMVQVARAKAMKRGSVSQPCGDTNVTNNVSNGVCQRTPTR